MILNVKKDFFWETTVNFMFRPILSDDIQLNEVTDDSYDILFLSVFPRYRKMYSVPKEKLLIVFNGENNDHIEDRVLFLLNRFPDIIIGYFDNELKEKHPECLFLDFPLWMYDIQFPLKDNHRNIDSLKYSCLINSHDRGNTRTPIYNVMRRYGHIDCPGYLYQNIPRIGKDRDSKLTFLQNYIFNICPENSYADSYCTEKIFDAVSGGCIPIYYGSFRNDEEKILNMNRIIKIESLNNLEPLERFLNEVYQDKQKLKDFYNQPIFTENAESVIQNRLSYLKSEFRKKVVGIITQSSLYKEEASIPQSG